VGGIGQKRERPGYDATDDLSNENRHRHRAGNAQRPHGRALMVVMVATPYPVTMHVIVAVRMRVVMRLHVVMRMVMSFHGIS